MPTAPLRSALPPEGWTPDGDAWRRTGRVIPHEGMDDESALEGWDRHAEPFAVEYAVRRLRGGAVRVEAALAGHLPARHLGRAGGVLEDTVRLNGATVEVSGERVRYERVLDPTPAEPKALAEAVAEAVWDAEAALVRAARTLHFFGMPLEGGWRAGGDPEGAIDSVTLERTPCYGTCPAYTVTVHADGRVEWEGGAWVDEPGPAQGHAGPDAVAALFRLFDSPFLARLADRQRRGDEALMGLRTDGAGAVLTVRRGPSSLEFHHEIGAGFDGEVHVYRLEAAVDRAAGLGRWSDGGTSRQVAPDTGREVGPSPR